MWCFLDKFFAIYVRFYMIKYKLIKDRKKHTQKIGNKKEYTK